MRSSAASCSATSCSALATRTRIICARRGSARSSARDFAQAFTRFDVLLTPTMPRTAPRLGALLYEEPLHMCLADVYTVSCNLAGLPGLSLPCGVASDGLPIGLQLLARPFDEARLLTVAAAYERARGDFPSPAGEPTHAEV
jgi:aspartyl-tRNA(Asn)/glutamyl-tRNA(Gln) amidotransferase subunit A